MTRSIPSVSTELTALQDTARATTMSHESALHTNRDGNMRYIARCNFVFPINCFCRHFAFRGNLSLRKRMCPTLHYEKGGDSDNQIALKPAGEPEHVKVKMFFFLCAPHLSTNTSPTLPARPRIGLHSLHESPPRTSGAGLRWRRTSGWSDPGEISQSTRQLSPTCLRENS